MLSTLFKKKPLSIGQGPQRIHVFHIDDKKIYLIGEQLWNSSHAPRSPSANKISYRQIMDNYITQTPADEIHIRIIAPTKAETPEDSDRYTILDYLRSIKGEKNITSHSCDMYEYVKNDSIRDFDDMLKCIKNTWDDIVKTTKENNNVEFEENFFLNMENAFTQSEEVMGIFKNDLIEKSKPLLVHELMTLFENEFIFLFDMINKLMLDKISAPRAMQMLPALTLLKSAHTTAIELLSQITNLNNHSNELTLIDACFQLMKSTGSLKPAQQLSMILTQYTVANIARMDATLIFFVNDFIKTKSGNETLIIASNNNETKSLADYLQSFSYPCHSIIKWEEDESLLTPEAVDIFMSGELEMELMNKKSRCSIS